MQVVLRLLPVTVDNGQHRVLFGETGKKRSTSTKAFLVARCLPFCHFSMTATDARDVRIRSARFVQFCFLYVGVGGLH